MEGAVFGLSNGVNGVSGGYLNKMRTREHKNNLSEVVEKTELSMILLVGGVW